MRKMMILRWKRLRLKEAVSNVETVMPDTVTSNDEVLAESTDNRRALTKPKISPPLKQSTEPMMSMKLAVNKPKVSAPLKMPMEPVMSTKLMSVNKPKMMAATNSTSESLKPAAAAVKQIISKPLTPATIPMKLPARQFEAMDKSNKLMSVPMKTPKNTEMSSSMPATTSKSSFQLSSETAVTSRPVLETTMKSDKPISSIVKPAKLQLKPKN